MTPSSREKKGGGPINSLFKSSQWRFSRDTMWNHKDKSERDPLGTSCHKFQQILIILSGVTCPRTFPTEFQAIAVQLHVHRPGCNARAQEIQKSFAGLVKSGHSRRCLLLPFVRPSFSNVLPSSGSRLTFTSWSRPSVIPSFFVCTDAQTCTKPLFVNVTRFFSVFFAVHATAPLSIGPFYPSMMRSCPASCVAIFHREKHSTSIEHSPVFRLPGFCLPKRDEIYERWICWSKWRSADKNTDACTYDVGRGV